jgi:predicted transcriptional regulator
VAAPFAAFNLTTGSRPALLVSGDADIFSSISGAGTPSQAGDVLRAARARAGISQRELARRGGTTQASISRIESGLEQPTLDRLARILAALGFRITIDLAPIDQRSA